LESATPESAKKERKIEKTEKKNARGTTGEQRPSRMPRMKLLTAKETAELLRVKPQWVYRMVRQGTLPGVRLGRQLRVDEDALNAWVAERVLSGNGLEKRGH
jgi:excisionase family DNA binding protein